MRATATRPSISRSRATSFSSAWPRRPVTRKPPRSPARTAPTRRRWRRRSRRSGTASPSCRWRKPAFGRKLSSAAAGQGREMPLRRVTALGVLVVGAVGLLGLAPQNAAAAPASVYVQGSTLVFEAAAGTVDDVTIALSDGVNYSITDSAGIAAGAGCTQDSADTATCLSAGVTTANINLGDQDDSIQSGAVWHLASVSYSVAGGDGADTIDADLPNVSEALVDGGPGDDVLFGSSGPDELDGGPGADVIWTGTEFHDDTAPNVVNGGEGDDTLIKTDNGGDDFYGGDGNDLVSYRYVDYGYDFGFGVSLDNAANDGPTGHDNVHTDVEQLQGGRGPDNLVGDDAGNVLDGWRNGDTVTGGAGDDLLVDSIGECFANEAADSYYGGPGIDTVSYAGRVDDLELSLDDLPNDGHPGEGDNVHSDVENLVGGCGNDVIRGDDSANVLVGNSGNDEIFSRDGVRDYVECGDGNDIAHVDSQDVTTGCETVDLGSPPPPPP